MAIHEISQEEMITEIFDNIDYSDDSKNNTPSMYIMSGSIGTGKSTLCRKLTNLTNAVTINKDSMLQSISGDFYGKFDSNKVQIYDNVEETTIRKAFELGQSVIVDRLNYNKVERKRFIDIAKSFNIPIISYDFGSGSEETLARRLKNPRGVPERVWRELFQLVKDNYEVPTIEEGFTSLLTPPDQKGYKFVAFDFDGTIATNPGDKFPQVGELDEDVANLARLLYKKFNVILILWTCRCDDALNEAITFLNSKRIFFDYYNENPICDKMKTSNKIYCDLLIDDKVISFYRLKEMIKEKRKVKTE